MTSSVIDSRKKTVLIFLFLSALLLAAGKSYCSTLEFDEDAVFCSYFMMSGDKLSEQDIEEFCFTDNRPTYTAFKPSEMFTKHSLINEKKRINNKIKSLNSDTTFIWKVTCPIPDRSESSKFLNMLTSWEALPQPTPYINSKLSADGKRMIKKAVFSYLKKQDRKKGKEEVEILISLKAENFEYGYQKRNIVTQDVVLPIRYVIFQPIKVQILDELEAIN